MDTVEWHRSEPRAIRPFFHAKNAEGAVENSRIQLFASEPATAEVNFSVDEFDLSKLSIRVTPSLAATETWLPEGYKPKDFSVAIICRSPSLKRSKVIKSVPASIFASEEIAIGAEELSYLGGGRNLRITVALCLTSDKPPAVGAPTVQGHWLASKTFTIREKTIPSLFDVQTRTDSEWQKAGFPAKTFYTVEYVSGITAEDSEGDSSVAVVYLHVDAFNRMAGEKIGDTIQSILAAEILAQILEQSRSEWCDLSTCPPKSPLATLLKKLQGTGISDLSTLREAMAKPGMLRAVLQDSIGNVQAISTGG